MTAPKRIHLRRTKGWRLPDGAIVVARPSKWGNPYRIDQDQRGGWCVTRADTAVVLVDGLTESEARSRAVDMFSAAVQMGRGFVPWPAEIRSALVGHDLACWCPLDQPCHADVLLEMANPWIGMDGGSRVTAHPGLGPGQGSEPRVGGSPVEGGTRGGAGDHTTQPRGPRHHRAHTRHPGQG